VDPSDPVETGRYCLVCCLEKGDEGTCGHCGAAVDALPPRQPSFLPPGALLDRRYLVGKSLGSGTFGITYLAVDIWLRLRVAVKEYMPREIAMRSQDIDVVPNTDEDLDAFKYGLQSFLDEGRKLARFEGHPHIVGVKSFFEENGTAYLVMQYLDGCSLEAYRRELGGRLPAGEVVASGVAILEGLQAIHDVGMLHRDIKPQNVILTTDGKVKLIDFGAARFAAGQRTSQLSQVLTPRYAPIEQYQADGTQGPWTDVYAAGATLYKVLTGQPPPEAIKRVLQGEPLPTPRSVLGDEVSPRISDALMRALEPSADARFQSAQEFLEALTDPESTPLVWPSPSSAFSPLDLVGDEEGDGAPSPSPVSGPSGSRRGAPVGASGSRGRAPSGSGSLRPEAGSGSSRSVRPRERSGSSSSRSVRPVPPLRRESTASTRELPGTRRRRRKQQRRARRLWLLNLILFLLVLIMGIVLALLLLEQGEGPDELAGCGRLSSEACAAEAVRLDGAGQAEGALLLAYLAPVEEPATRDRIFGNAGVGADWGTRDRFDCAAPPTPCNSLDFWSADRDAPEGDRALSALSDRCDAGDRDACFLRILVQRRFTLIESDAPPGDEPVAGGSEPTPRTASSGQTAAPVVEPVRPPDPVGGPGGTASTGEPASASFAEPEATPAERTVGEPDPPGEPSERVVGAPDEPAERVVGEPAERVVGDPDEPAERVVGEPDEPSERVVDEPAERVVDEPAERVVDEPAERVVDEPDDSQSE